MIELYSRQYGLNGLIVRLSRIFGPGQNQVHPIGPLSGAAVVGKELKWKSGADHGLNYSYVKDCAEGIIAVYSAENPKHQAYNIGEGRIVKNSYVIERLKELIPEAKIEIGPISFFLKREFYGRPWISLRPLCSLPMLSYLLTFL